LPKVWWLPFGGYVVYCVHDLDLSGSRVVIEHVTVWSQVANLFRCSIATKSVFSCRCRDWSPAYWRHYLQFWGSCDVIRPSFDHSIRHIVAVLANPRMCK